MINKEKSGIVKKTFFRTFVVQLITMIIGVIGMVIDGAVTGSLLSVDHMAAYGIVLPILTIFAAIATMVQVGVSTTLGRVMGKGDTKEIKVALSSCFITTIILAILVTLFMEFGAGLIAKLLGTKDGVIFEYAKDYLIGFGFCAPAMLLVMVMLPILQLNGDGKRLIIAVLLMTVVNIAGDFLNGLVLHWGLLGMALATSVSYYVALFVELTHFISKKKNVTLSFKKINFSYIGSMFLYGFPPALQQICKSVLIICMNRLILKTGTTNDVAIYSSLMSVANLCLVLGSAVGTSLSIIGTVYDGQRNLNSHKKLVKVAFLTTLIINGIMTGILVIGSPIIMPLFLSSADDSLKQLTISAFRLYATNTIFYSINVLIRSYLESSKKIIHSYVYSVLNMFLFTYLFAIVLSKTSLGINGIWLSYTCGECFSLICYFIFAICSSKNKNLLERLMLVPKKYFKGVLAQECAIINSSTENKYDELLKISEFVSTNVDSKKDAFAMNLCIEEVTNNIVKYGFKKNNNLEISLTKRDNGWTIMFTDDCVLFNPLDFFAKHKNDDEYSGIGIKLFTSLSHDIKYISVLSLNTLIINF